MTYRVITETSPTGLTVAQAATVGERNPIVRLLTTAESRDRAIEIAAEVRRYRADTRAFVDGPDADLPLEFIGPATLPAIPRAGWPRA